MSNHQSSWRTSTATDATALILEVFPRIYKAVAQSIEDDHKTVLPTRTHYRLLGLLHQSPGLSLTDLAQRMGIAKTNASPLVEALVEAGLVNRTLDPSDRRQSLLSLSQTGLEEYEHGMTRLRAAFEGLLSGISDDEGRELEIALALVLDLFRKLTSSGEKR